MYPWLLGLKDNFLLQVKNSCVAHAYLVAVDTAWGADEFCTFMANTLLCIHKKDCGECKSCNLLKASTHPDLYILEAEGKQIKVDQIRSVCKSLANTAQQEGYRIVIIKQTELMNTSAANALLKTLEEPGVDTVLILQTNSKQMLLPTITSRTQCLALNTNVDITNYLLEQQVEYQEDPTWALPLVRGPLALVAALKDGEYQKYLMLRDSWRKSLECGSLDKGLIDLKAEMLPIALTILQLELKRLMKEHIDSPFMVKKLGELAAEAMSLNRRLTLSSGLNINGLLYRFSAKLKIDQKVR